MIGTRQRRDRTQQGRNRDVTALASTASRPCSSASRWALAAPSAAVAAAAVAAAASPWGESSGWGLSHM